MQRNLAIEEHFTNQGTLQCGLTINMLASGIKYVYDTLDKIDEKLVEVDSPRLSNLVELANLSTIIGNLFNIGIIKASQGLFERAGPHKYQDLRATKLNPYAENIEIKVALEDNKPKGHLPKTGHYLTCRYILGDEDGNYAISKRGEVVWIWELRCGYLEKHHFNVSNTAGDSGKTAVINREGLEQLQIIYFDRAYCPHGPKSQYWQHLKQQASQENLPLF